MHLDEAFAGEQPQRLAHGRAADAEACHQLALVHDRAGLQLERDDQLADPVVGLVRERLRLAGLGLEEWERRAHARLVYYPAPDSYINLFTYRSRMSTFPAQARALVIGCGIVGNSLAYHLCDQGWSDVVLIDKGPLPNPGGSTGHASNFIFLADHSKEMTQLTLESTRQYKQLDVFTECGGIEVARTEERMEELRRRMASAKAWGIEPVSLVTPAEIKELVPYIDESILLGGFHTPGVGVVDSLRAGTIMRERAVEAGALTVFAGTEVAGMDVEQGRIRRVHTSRGTIEAEAVVIACGVWSPLLARMAGAHIPLTPAVHQMIDIGPVPRFAQAKAAIEFPIVRDMDVFMYERQDGTSLEIGSYAHRSILHDPEEIPSLEEAALSPTEFPFTQADFDPQMVDALDLMPEIVGDESVGVKYAINGLIALTPDGMPILGETPEVKGLWSAAAVWVKEGPGVGKSLAEWMVHGESHIDLHSSDVSRFHAHQLTRAHVKARTFEAFPKTYGIVHPAEQWSSDRNLRVSPMHERERALGAVFFEAAGWERPQWYEANAPLVERYGVESRDAEWDARWWSPIVNAEHLAMREHAGLFDLSAFCIFDVQGPGALDALQRAVLAQMDVAVGRVVYTPVLSPGGGFRSDLTIMRLGDTQFRIVTGGAHGMADRKRLHRHAPAGRLGDARRRDDRLDDDRPLGAAGARHPLERHLGRRLARGAPVRIVPDARDRLAARARVTDLVRRRPRLGAVRPVRAGRPAVGRPLGGRRAARPDGVRHRRLRHDRAAREVLPGLRRRARERVHRRRGGDAAADREGAGLRREGGPPPSPRRGASGHPVHVDGRRPHGGERGEALPTRTRADHAARRDSSDRREGSLVVRDERGRRPVGREAPPHGLPPARACGRGLDRARGRVHDRAAPGHGRRGRRDADLRPREHQDALVTPGVLSRSRGAAHPERTGRPAPRARRATAT